MSDRPLMRSPDGIVGGVAAGLAEHFDQDVNIVRLVVAGAIVMTGFGALLLYLVAWAILPLRPG